MARVFRPRGDVLKVSRDKRLVLAATDGIYEIKNDSLRLLEEGPGEAIDTLEERVVYAKSGVVYIDDRQVDIGARVMDISISQSGLVAIAAKINKIVVAYPDGSTEEIPLTNRGTSVDRLGYKTLVMATRDGRVIVYDVEEHKQIDEIRVSRPFTSVVCDGDYVYVGVSDGGIYRFKPHGDIEPVGEHERRVFDLDVGNVLASVGEDRYLKLWKNGLLRSRKLHFDTYTVAVNGDKLAVGGTRYVWIAEIDEIRVFEAQ